MTDQEKSLRTICQIQIAVQEAEPDITEEEMRLCIEALRTITSFYSRALIELIEAVRDENMEPFLLRFKAESAWQTVEAMFKAEKRDPASWLGPDNIPGSPKQKQSLAWAKRVYEKATGEKL